jgi:hypothetical protein
MQRPESVWLERGRTDNWAAAGPNRQAEPAICSFGGWQMSYGAFCGALGSMHAPCTLGAAVTCTLLVPSDVLLPEGKSK